MRATIFRRMLGTLLPVLLTIAASTVASTVAATPAKAVAVPRLVEVESVSSSAATHTAQAACEQNEDVYGSGYYVKNGKGRVTVNEVYVQFQLWYVQVTAQMTDEGLSGAWSVVAQAICGPHVEGLHREFVEVGKSTSRGQNAWVTCTTGVAYGGGFKFQGADGRVFLNALILDAAHAGVSVSATVDNSSSVPAAGWGILAFVVCGPPAPVMALRKTAAVEEGSTSPRDETADCGGNGRPHGAGMTTGVVTAGADRGNIVLDQMRLTSTGAYVQAWENNDTDGDWAVSAQVICAT